MTRTSRAMPSRLQIVTYWKDWLVERGFDLERPCCWACRLPFPFSKSGTMGQRWTSAAGLQRAHILADSRGGRPTPDNLFLLCKECHGKAPSVGDKTLFLEWALKQDWRREYQRNFEYAVEMVCSDEVDRGLFRFWLDSQSQGTVDAAAKAVVAESATHRGYAGSQASQLVSILNALYSRYETVRRSVVALVMSRVPSWKRLKTASTAPEWTKTAGHRFTNSRGDEWYAEIDLARHVILLTGIDVDWRVFEIGKETAVRRSILTDLGLILGADELQWLENVIGVALALYPRLPPHTTVE